MKTLRKLIVVTVFCAVSLILITPADAGSRGRPATPPTIPTETKPAGSGL